jgi:alanine racemase
MAKYLLSRLASFCGGEVSGEDRVISRLIIDSRKLFNPDGTIFVAIEGATHDGHQYISELYDKGVRAFIVTHRFGREASFDGASFIKVDNSTAALQAIAASHRRNVGCGVVAITGSNGKTIVKEWISHLLGDDIVNVRSPRSYNSQVGVPLSLWQLNDDTGLGIIEAGISMRGEMGVLEGIIAPNEVIITNIGPAHQENFASIEEKLSEKLLLCRNAGTIIFCGDNKLVAGAVRNSYPTKNLVSWGREEGSTLRITNLSTNNGTTNIQFDFGNISYRLAIPFSDAASIENALHAVCYSLYKGIRAENVISRCATLETVGMRLEQKEGHNNCLIIDDAYNADVSSLEIALDFLHQQGNKKGLKPTLILSDIFQTGITADKLYSQVVELVEEKGVQRLIGIGPSISKALAGRVKNGRFFLSTAQFLGEMSMSDFRNEAILLKGSRSFMFERIVEMLEQKRHRTVMEINLNALADNIGHARSCLKPETKILAMLKAFSYGSGSYEIASLMQHQKIDYLGVAFADEGYDMRAAGINLPIIVMNPDVRSFGMMLDYDLEPEIYNADMLRKFARAVSRQGLSSAAVHIKIDTGMYRLGFLPHQMPELLDELKSNPNLYVKSVFSHLVGSDDGIHDEFTRLQISRFEQACSQIAGVTGYSFMRHILNSAGIERFPEAQYEMVRLGIGLYGISSMEENKLRNVATLKSYISQIKTVPAGSTIGYSRKAHVDSDTIIGIVPVGYADGLDRRLSNGGGCLIVGGKKAPIIGNVCMDMCMIDLTGISANEGDEAIVFGDSYPVWEMAKSVGTIPYEVLTGIGRRVKRIYFYE